MGLYGAKLAGGSVQPWSQVITLAEAGKGCDGLFNLYDSLGDVTINADTNIPSVLDGPEKVVRYGALTLGDGITATSLTASNRCKGLTILCDSLLVKANATLHMTGRGARVDRADDPFFPFIDYKIPFKVSLDSSRMSLPQALAVIKIMGLAPWDIGTFQHVIAGMFGFNLAVSLAGSLALMLASGCGPGTLGPVGTGVGIVGVAGSNGGCGGGGSGGNWSNACTCICDKSGYGCPYSGGCGGGANGQSDASIIAHTGSKYSGPGGRAGGIQYGNSGALYPGDPAPIGLGGGGAGNPGGSKGTYVNDNPGSDGCGGKLTIICRGAISVQSGGKVEANGMPGGAGTTYCGGGGSGGGHVSLISPTAPSNAGTIQAAGGAGGLGGSGNGGNGGAGSVVTKTFADMGW